jgi:hypothetical protein
MSAASPVEYCCGWASAAINVLTVEQPAMVGCVQVQPVETIGLSVDVQSQVGREQVSVFFDAAPAAVDRWESGFFLRFPHRHVWDTAVVLGLHS